MSEGRSRPDPDELLARVKAEEEQEHRGKLKIFLGYAPGVGKTYTMLEAAHQRKKDTDVVVAYLDTHGRAETEAMLEGLEVVDRTRLEYRGIRLTEMDLDAVLVRAPKIALVDELAHENAPGSRHPKRYQDVEELLEAGIDIYTTLNVQHIESGRNVVAQITGVWVRETVPDSIIDKASEIELVDLPPDELLQRLAEGKVYVPEQIAPARDKFFRKGNLTALRELALRTAARHVDDQTLLYMKTHAIRGPWPSAERLLLLIAPGSLGSRIARSARRLAHDLNAGWFAVHVETPDGARLSPGEHDRITESMRLAARLGAETVTLQGHDVPSAVLEYARANNITKIIVGKPKAGWFHRLLGVSAADRIIRRSGDIDVYLASESAEPAAFEKPSAERPLRGRATGYLQGAGLVAVATALGKLAPGFLTDANLIMVYLLCVVATAFLWGFGPSLLVSFLSVLLFDFLFVPPFFSFTVNDTKYAVTFVSLLIVGLMISYLMGRVRHQTDAVLRRERETAALYALGRDLAVSNDLDSYIAAITRRARETFGQDVLLFLPDPHREDMLRVYGPGPVPGVSDNEMAAAVWSYRHQRMVGQGTDTLPNAAARYLPLVAAARTVGVIALQSSGTSIHLSIEQERLLEAYADLAAIALESAMAASRPGINAGK